jgi:tRNA modification GTPase
VLRISGPAAGAALARLTSRPLPAPRRATLRTLVDPADGEPLDGALVLRFVAPASYTGEDLVELHLHGGPAVQAAVEAALGRLPGLRPAAPGEFTRRAFLAGKLDLTQAEAVADLIDATSRAQARQALRQLDGALARLVARWRGVLVDALALIEAEIDFAAEEGDVAEALLEPVRPTLAALAAEIDAQLAGAPAAERLRHGLAIAVTGPPNAGKSTLVNRLAGREVAIVTPIAGTTRDALEVQLDLGGYAVTLIDTAGLRESADPIEREGVRRARQRAADADLRLFLVAADAPAVAVPADALVVRTKIDLAIERAWPEATAAISAVTGEGIDALVRRLTTEVERLTRADGPVTITAARHRHALTTARAALRAALDGAAPRDLGLIAEDLRQAARAVGAVSDAVGAEEILDRVFARFCIGK